MSGLHGQVREVLKKVGAGEGSLVGFCKCCKKPVFTHGESWKLVDFGVNVIHCRHLRRDR